MFEPPHRVENQRFLTGCFVLLPVRLRLSGVADQDIIRAPFQDLNDSVGSRYTRVLISMEVPSTSSSMRPRITLSFQAYHSGNSSPWSYIDHVAPRGGMDAFVGHNRSSGIFAVAFPQG